MSNLRSLPISPAELPRLLYPPNNQTLRDDTITYRWQPVENARAYHLLVSRDPGFRWPYRPGLDVIYQGAEYTVPFWGIYSPDTLYRWRLRPQNDKGIWGDWSAPQSFQWSGPRIPVDMQLSEKDATFILAWQPNPRGPRPHHYEIYGSDIKGFSISKEPYEVPSLGAVPPNYLGRTTAVKIPVAGPDIGTNPPLKLTLENPDNLNRCYYRVVAVDAHGVHSGPGDYVELPHPHIYSRPLTSASPGQPYRYQLRCFTSLGDLQYRYTKPNQKFWEREQLTWSLLQAPSWLHLDPASGLLSGTPPADARGAHPVRLRLTAAFEKRTGKDKFTPDLPPRRHDQAFTLQITPAPPP